MACGNQRIGNYLKLRKNEGHEKWYVKGNGKLPGIFKNYSALYSQTVVKSTSLSLHKLKYEISNFLLTLIFHL